MNLSTSMQSVGAIRGGIDGSFARAVPTGFAQLDALLPCGGWPLGALTEIVIPHDCSGELQLLLPALARMSRSNRWLALVAPPRVPDPRALTAAQIDLTRMLLVHPRAHADGLLAVEQSLQAGTCAAVVAWPALLDSAAARQLQRAAEIGGSCGWLFRPQGIMNAGRATALCLRVLPTSVGVDVCVLQRSARRWTDPVSLDLRLSQALPARASSVPSMPGVYSWQFSA